MKRLGRLPAGLIAGAAGTTALNMLTYLDMATRGRPASSMPAQAAEKLAEGVGLDLAAGGDEDTEQNRAQGLGALLGFGAGLGSGLLYPMAGARLERWSFPAQAIAVTVVAMMAGNLPSSAMGLTDPRKWSISDWMTDILPHLGYGSVTAAVYRAIRS